MLRNRGEMKQLMKYSSAISNIEYTNNYKKNPYHCKKIKSSIKYTCIYLHLNAWKENISLFLLIDDSTHRNQTNHTPQKSNYHNAKMILRIPICFFVMMHVLNTSKDLVEFREQIKVNIDFRILVVYSV